ncbi:hypothetical protein Btru_043139 [Bulinus truncatus]|nr:hypothetical protein Btru_043139 [Bulinus truncatus]
MVKKRQAMRNALGDYRKKMKDAEKKTLAGLRHSQFKAIDTTKLSRKSKFLRQSHSKQFHPANSQLLSTLTNLNINNSQTSTCVETIGIDLACQPNCSKSKDSENMFKYVPSDNSFCFGFKGEAAEKESEVLAGGKPEDNTVPANSEKNHGNFFEFQSSSNDFQFNFETTECGS